MSNLTNAAETRVGDWLLTSAAVTRPTAWFLALFTAAPGEAGGGTEVSGSGYSRQSVTFTAGTNPYPFPEANKTFTASGGSWGTITHWALFDASTGGNMLFYGALTASRVVNDGDSVVANTGQFTITWD